jgi:CDP-diacylglycerol--glycerol-3-phosphate 3-phosphatidyltransferase
MNLPNKLTVSRIFLAPVFLILILIEDVWARVFALGVFIVAALTDLYDGYLARRYGIQTGFGKFMDPLADKILTSSAFVAFVALGYARVWMVLPIVIRELFITGMRSVAAYRGVMIRPSFAAKVKTFLQMVVIVLILGFVNIKTFAAPLGWEWAWLESPKVAVTFDYLMFATMVITVYTGLDYLWRNASLWKGLIK